MGVHLYEGLEIRPCRAEPLTGGVCFFHECPPDLAEFWLVYGRSENGPGNCLKIFSSREKALDYAQELLETWPNLNSLGLVGSAVH